MKAIAFTIVAKNYIGLGQVLGQSLQRHNLDVAFRIYVADEFPCKPDDLPDCVVTAKDVIGNITEQQWRDMAFKYDLTEFCTAIKPFCFGHAFAEGYEKAFYFDPDIYVFSSIQPLLDALDTHSMTLTPQIAGIHPHYTGEHPEWAMNVNGIFNLGFCGIRADVWGRRMVAWWQERLRDNAFADRAVGNFTDQKWMDWAPGFLGERLYVQPSLGMNLAPWNFFEREVWVQEGTWRVRFRTDDCPQRNDAVTFVHFAGYDYNMLKQGIVKRKRIEDLKEYADIEQLGAVYRDAIVANATVFDRFIRLPYSYATYADGTHIAAFHRRLYHGLTAEMKIENPFATGKGTLHDMLRKKGMLIKETIDHVSRRNLSDLEGKRRQMAIFYKALYRILGYKRYVMFLKSLYFYCRPEMHTFHIKHKQP